MARVSMPKTTWLKIKQFEKDYNAVADFEGGRWYVEGPGDAFNICENVAELVKLIDEIEKDRR